MASNLKTVVLCYSGGLDSTVMLYNYLCLGYDIKALSVNYGQRHKKELERAKIITRNIVGVEHRVIDLSNMLPLLAGSSQTSEDMPVPEGHYEEESMKQTVVPNRNMILMALAGAWCVSTKADGVGIAAHAGDHAVYPDCRPVFMDLMEKALHFCDWHSVNVLRPFLEPTGMSKADIVKEGARLSVPFKMTWSCYKGGEKHCGRCGTDVERKEAFRDARVPDPTEYEDDSGAYRG